MLVTAEVSVTVEVGVLLAVGMFVDVTVAVDVLVGVIVRVAVAVTVDDGVDVRVAIEVDVAVPVSTPWVSMTSCGGVVPSREENVTPSVLSATNANVYVPFPLTNELTLYSTHVLVPKAPWLSIAPLNRAG